MAFIMFVSVYHAKTVVKIKETGPKTHEQILYQNSFCISEKNSVAKSKAVFMPLAISNICHKSNVKILRNEKSSLLLPI